MFGRTHTLPTLTDSSQSIWSELSCLKPGWQWISYGFVDIAADLRKARNVKGRDKLVHSLNWPLPRQKTYARTFLTITILFDWWSSPRVSRSMAEWNENWFVQTISWDSSSVREIFNLHEPLPVWNFCSSSSHHAQDTRDIFYTFKMAVHGVRRSQVLCTHKTRDSIVACADGRNW